ncbi:MAG: hypothetical protein AAFQ87_09560 [Bacteroidota bacterium]
MDKLKTILTTLSTDEQKAFSRFLQRQKPKANRKDEALVNLLLADEETDIVAQLYPDQANAVAYHALRKRLMQQLRAFLMLRQYETDPSAASTIMGHISLARYLFNQRLSELACQYLHKAEKLALANEHHDLLHTIYLLQIEKLDQAFPEGIDTLLEKLQHNRQRLDEDERANIACSLIARRLEEVRQKGRHLDFDETVQEVLKEYQLKEAIAQRPSLFMKLMKIARSAVLVKRDFNAFEPFIIGQYEQMERNFGFAQTQHRHHLELLYMIAHVLYRNKKFVASLHWCEKLIAEASRHKKSHWTLFYPRVVMLQAANHLFLNQSGEAVDLLKGFLEKPEMHTSRRDQLNAWFNLGITYFLRKEYALAFRCGLNMPGNEKAQQREMGREWVLKKYISEVILQMELGNEDLVLKHARIIEKQYGDLLATPLYAKAKTFLNVIRKMIHEPEQFQRPEIYDQIRQQFPIKTAEKEDLQEMSFYAWLKARLLGENYYEVLLELVGRVD